MVNLDIHKNATHVATDAAGLWPFYTSGTHCSAHPIRPGSTCAVRQCIFSVHTIEFSCAAGSRDNTLRVWNVQTAHTIQVLEGHEYQVRHVLFNFAFATSGIVNTQAVKGYMPAQRLLLPCCKCLLMDKCGYAAGYWCDCTSRWVYCLLCSR